MALEWDIRDFSNPFCFDACSGGIHRWISHD